MKYIIGVVILCLGFGCKQKQIIASNTDTIKVAETKVDTLLISTDTVTAVVLPTENLIPYINLIKSIENNKTDYTTFSATLDVSYSAKESYDFTAYLRMQKDSIIWFSASVFGLEIFRCIIKNDSVVLLDKINKKATIQSMLKFSNMLGVSISLPLLQQIILGDLINLSSEYKNLNYTDHDITYKTQKNPLSSEIHLHDSLLIMQQFQAMNDANTYLNINFDDYHASPFVNKLFSFMRKIKINSKDTMAIVLKFNNVKFNEKLLFPNTIPNQYQIIRE